MSIQRQNILDLIGRNQSKYASGIITCFSFDFTFFEQRIMSVLNAANIRNVNVFVDDKFLDNALEQSEGGEFQTNKTYSINGIRAKGVFHPKIMFLAGPKHGLLFLGSGNLTNSGLSSNDEVWGAFHLNGIDSQNAPLFAQVWRYMERFQNQADGINAEKLLWVKQRAPWIDELLSADFPDEIQLNDKLQVQFLANEETSVYTKLLEALPQKELDQLNIVSPYFDEKGKFLTEIMEDLNPKLINCITDTQFGILPHKLEQTIKDRISFYEWKNCSKDATDLSRLHAKIFQFKYVDGSEYLLFGSANATSHAFGGKTKKAVNEEATLLINNSDNPDYLAGLGINWSDAEPLLIEVQGQKKNNVGDSIASKKILYRIKHAEIKDNRVTIYFDQISEVEGDLLILDKWCKTLLRAPLTDEDRQTFILNTEEEPNRLCVDKGDERVSNFALIHNVNIQEKSNPDPKQAEINELIENLEDNPEGGFYISLLKYADYNWVDHELENKSRPSISNRKPREVEEVKEYEKIDQDQFYALSSVQQSQALLLKETGVRITDVLSIISKGRLKKEEDVSESEEEKQASTDFEDQTGEGDVVKSLRKQRHDGSEEKRVIHGYLKKTQDFYKGQLSIFLTEKNLADSPNRELQLKDYSNILIALDLVNIFMNRTYETQAVVVALFDKKELHKEIEKLEYQFKMRRLERTSRDYPNLVYLQIDPEKVKNFRVAAQKIEGLKLLEQEEYETKSEVHNYFISGRVTDQKGILFYLTNMLGSFLIASNRGAIEYSYQLVNDKIELYRKEIFERSIFLILNNRWKESEEKYRDLLILDLLHFICPLEWKQKSEEEIKEIFKETYQKAQNKSQYFEANMKKFVGAVNDYNIWFSKFKQEPKQLSKPKNELRFGQIIFSSKIGFSQLNMVKEKSIVIVKPGLDWNKMHGGYAMKLNYPQNRILIF